MQINDRDQNQGLPKIYLTAENFSSLRLVYFPF